MSQTPRRRKLTSLERAPIIKKLKEESKGWSSWYYRIRAEEVGGSNPHKFVST